MEKVKILSCLLAITIIFFAACDAGQLNAKAEKSADDFYADLQKKNYDAALDICSERAFKEDPKVAWKRIFGRNAGLLGDIKSFTKSSGFNIATSTTTGTTVSVAYDVQWQYGKSTDSIFLEKQSDGSMKIYRYVWLHKDAKYMTEMAESEKQASQYIESIKADKLDAAIAFCSPQALLVTPKDKWIAFLKNANNKLGTITNYNIVLDSSSYDIAAKGSSGEGNYFDVLVECARGSNKVKEKLVFFQKNYNDALRLAGHSFL